MYNNQFFNQRAYQPMYQPQQFQVPQYQTQQYQPISGLQGRIVDNVDAVKVMDTPLDGSISYFALVDGSAIVTKQLQNDGTSKMIVYKPVVEETPKNITNEEFEKEISKLREEIGKINKRLGDGRYDQSQSICFKYDTENEKPYT